MRRPVVLSNNAPPLEERIAALQDEIDAICEARAREISKSSGVPFQNILMMMGQTANGCQCKAALKMIADKKRDEDIAARH